MNTRILDILSTLSEQDIQRMTSPIVFERGQEYSQESRVKIFFWDKDKKRLSAFVQGSKTYQVTISLIDNDLRCVCSCPAWNNILVCKHVICVLLVAKRLLDEDMFQRAVKAGKDKNVYLRQGLFGSASTREQQEASAGKKRDIKIHLKPEESYTLFARPYFSVVLMDGQQVLDPYSFIHSSSHPELAQLPGKNTHLWGREKLFHDFLTKNSNKCPIFVIHTDQGLLEVTWDSKEVLEPITELNLVNNNVQIKRMAKRADGTFADDIITIGELLLVDITKKSLVAKGMMHTWKWADNIIEQVGRATRMSMIASLLLPEQISFFEKDKSVFHKTSELFPLSSQQFDTIFALTYNAQTHDEFHDDFIFKHDNILVNPALVPSKRMIDGSIDFHDNLIRLEPRWLIDEQAIPLAHALFDYLDKIDTDLSAWLRTKTRRTLIAKALFSLLAADSDTEAGVIKNAVKEIRLSYVNVVSVAELKNYLIDFYAYFLQTNHVRILVCKNKFYRVMLDNRYLWQAFFLLDQAFEHSFVMQEKREKNKETGFVVSLALFYEKFFEFKELLDKHDIAFQLNQKKVKAVTLDISVTASDRGGDWLDVAPHILAEGIELSDDQREMLFSEEGVIETADCIQILDPQSREIIKILAKILKRSGDNATVQNKRDVVQVPRLRILDLLDLRQHGAKVLLSPEDEQLIDSLSNFARIKKTNLPKKMSGALRDYQVAGYQWLAFLYVHRFGACLADDMGLGKTIQAIAFLGGIAEGAIANQCATDTPHLIVMPPTLIFNWQQELHKFYPALRVKEYAGATRDTDFTDIDIVLITYDRVRLDIDKLKDITFHVVIFDEAQAIKNIYSERAAAARQLKSTFTLCLTGTPLENHIGEYYSIIDLALPGLLPEYKVFKNIAQAEGYDDLIKKTKPFVLRRTKDAILKELPPKVESDVYLTMTEKQQKVYATTVTEVKRLIDDAYTTKTGAQANIIALTAILRLRQICISPQMVDKKKDHSSPKIDYLVSMLEELIQEDSAALVFSQFTSCLDLIEHELVKAKITFYRIDGKTPIAVRKRIVESFQANNQNIAVLLLSLKTGGVGLNLTRANYVFHVDPWWNPAVENQASDRSHRIGQQKTVFVTRLLMHHTIEEKMMLLKQEKQKLFQSVMEQSENKKGAGITKKDFDLLLS